MVTSFLGMAGVSLCCLGKYSIWQNTKDTRDNRIVVRVLVPSDLELTIYWASMPFSFFVCKLGN